MARPRQPRRVCGQPRCASFKPAGIPRSELQSITLASDELEALRLADQLGLLQIEAAVEMGVSRQTFANILKSARGKVANALIQGWALELPATATLTNDSGENHESRHSDE